MQNMSALMTRCVLKLCPSLATSDEKNVNTDQPLSNLAQDSFVCISICILLANILFLFQVLPHLHRQGCIRKTSPMRSPSPENKMYNGVTSNSPLKVPINATSNQSSDEYSMSQSHSDVSASSPSPDKPLTPGGSLDTEQLFGDMISAPSTSPQPPPFPVPSPSPLNSTLSPDDTTPVDSPKQPRAVYEDTFDDIAPPLPPANDSLMVVDDPVIIFDEPIIIPAPPEFSECSQLSNASESNSTTHPLTASGSMQVIQDVISMMEQNIAQTQEDHRVALVEELQAAQPCMQNIATVGIGSEQTLSCSSSNGNQRAVVAVNTSNTLTNTGSDSPKAKITYDSSSSEIQIAIVAKGIIPNEGHSSPKTNLPWMHNALRHAVTFDGTTVSDQETTPKASRHDGTVTSNAETRLKASRHFGTVTSNAETTPKASRQDVIMPNAETTPRASRLDGAITPDIETTQKSLRQPQSRVHQLAREFSKKIRNTTPQDAEVLQASIEVSMENPPPWLKRLKQKKGTNGTDSDDSDNSPQPPPKQSSKLSRQKSLTLSRFNSTKDVSAAASDTTVQSSKENASVPEKRKAFTMNPSSSASAQVSIKSKTLPKVERVNSTKVPTSSVISQAQTPSPPVSSRIPSSLESQVTPTKTIPEHSNSQASEILQSKKSSEETNGAELVATADKVQLQSNNSKRKSSTLHRLSVVDRPNEGPIIKRAVSEANLVQQDTTTNESEPQQRQRFKGWVKSLVDKFSSK